MLYDQKWERPEVKADPFSLDDLIAWLEKQSANRTYRFVLRGECLLSQWVRSIDPGAHCTPEQSSFWYTVNGEPVYLHKFLKIANGEFPDSEHTFGAALRRALTSRT